MEGLLPGFGGINQPVLWLPPSDQRPDGTGLEAAEEVFASKPGGGCVSHHHPASWSTHLWVEYTHNSLVCSATRMYMVADGFQPQLFLAQETER